MTIAPKTPEDPGSWNESPEEALERRDLQNAQMTSMEHVWDNPTDEHWNDIPLSADEANMPTAPAPMPQFANISEFTAWLMTQPPTGRSVEEIDRQIQEERDSWE